MKHLFLFAVAALTLFAFGCAITDYEGFGGHQTSSEAKLWGQEIAFITGDSTLDGTYAYTVKYNNRTTAHDANMKIVTYRNPVVSSFSRDGQIDREGDEVQGRSGVLGGKFLPKWTVIDALPGCQFYDNVIHGNPIPPIALCATVNEEVDKDLELQASFSNVGDLLSQIWTGSLNNGFTLEITGLTLGGVNVSLAQPVSLAAHANGVRPTQFSLDLTQPGGAGLIQAILNNTADGVPVSLGLQFAGGMSVNLPSQFTVAFDHDALWNLL